MTTHQKMIVLVFLIYVPHKCGFEREKEKEKP